MSLGAFSGFFSFFGGLPISLSWQQHFWVCFCRKDTNCYLLPRELTMYPQTFSILSHACSCTQRFCVPLSHFSRTHMHICKRQLWYTDVPEAAQMWLMDDMYSSFLKSWQHCHFTPGKAIIPSATRHPLKSSCTGCLNFSAMWHKNSLARSNIIDCCISGKKWVSWGFPKIHRS